MSRARVVFSYIREGFSRDGKGFEMSKSYCVPGIWIFLRHYIFLDGEARQGGEGGWGGKRKEGARRG